MRYVYRHDARCEVPTPGPLHGSTWRLADREAPWDVEDGEELTLCALGGGRDQIIAKQQRDWIFARLPESNTCP